MTPIEVAWWFGLGCLQVAAGLFVGLRATAKDMEEMHGVVNDLAAQLDERTRERDAAELRAANAERELADAWDAQRRLARMFPVAVSQEWVDPDADE